MTDRAPLPVVQGDWVAENRDEHCVVARVRQSYYDSGDAVLMDLVFYDFSGEKIGRQSPSEGGPKTFEPACEWSERWIRISPPIFPLKLSRWNIPSEDKPGWYRPIHTIHDRGYLPGAERITSGQSVAHQAVRTKYKAQSSDRPRTTAIRYIDVQRPSNGPEFERAGLLRAAQELRQTAKLLGNTSAADMLIHRARALETEAEALA